MTLVEHIGPATLYLGDCLEVMASIPDGSVDLILCDLPYGTTACKWDTVIPFEPLWAHYKRVIKHNGAIVLTASQPFTSALVMSNIKGFKYEWIWLKSKPVGHLNAKHRPMLAHESVLVFCDKKENYFPQGLTTSNKLVKRTNNGAYGACSKETRMTHTGFPRSTDLFFKHDESTGHPTQKPVALMEYLIRTYTREGETVLDNCMGSGTTGVACTNTGHKFIGIELDPGYFDIAYKRVEKAVSDSKQNLFLPSQEEQVTQSEQRLAFE
jgi:site-specific DNA-methyltransferase (adenine-specific)